jgi:hypothetical protein
MVIPRTRYVAGLLLLALSLWIPSAIAFPVTFEFEGVIESVTHVTSVDPFGAGISVGTTFSGRYTFDTSTPNTGTSEAAGYVETAPQFGISVRVGAFFGSSSTALVPLNYRIIIGGLVNDDVIQDIQTQDMLFGGVNASLAQIFLEGPSTALSSVALSEHPPVLADYFVHEFVLGIGPPTHAEDVVYQGQITSIHAIPEPSTLGLLALAALACLARKRLNKTVDKLDIVST